MTGLESLRAALREQGGALAQSTRSNGSSSPSPGPPQRAASGPRVAGRGEEYELLLEMILEGSQLHYGEQRVVATDDPDLALLLGDQLYALGLARLAEIGDLEAVIELADVISLVAQAQATSDPELAVAAWEAGAVAIGWGESDEQASAKELARAGDPQASSALRRAAQVDPQAS